MSELPVREMVLYKHGVGFFVREGHTDAHELELTFRRDEINDVLKSLAVFDRAGGQVLGVHYQTPMDKAARLASSSILLSDDASLSDLLRNLRGRQVTAAFETTPGTEETVSGRVVGIEGYTDPNANRINITTAELTTGMRLAVMDNNTGQVRVFLFDALRMIRIDDRQAHHDLSYFLDTSKSEVDRRTVTVRLSAGQHDVVVYYVAPSPTWRVSYRLVAESDEDESSGKGLLQGWGLFDNRLEEDLDDVQVTLVAGQPISFIYELYASKIPHRPTVQDEARIAPGPIEFAAETVPEDIPDWLKDTMDAERTGRAQRGRDMNMMLASPSGRMARRMEAATPAAMAQTAPPAAEAKAQGEFFQYVVTTPVSVRRGESALVPIIGSEVQYARELLYNRAKLPNHPVASLRFDNKTGLTLERGPVTVVEDGDYKGEAVVPFTKEDNQVYLPYAVELGVRITEHTRSSVQTTGLYIKDRYLFHDQYQVEETTYKLENTTGKTLTVTIEAPINANYELFETRHPDVETAAERRWKVSAPARGKAEFTRKERRRSRHAEELRDLTYRGLQEYLANRWLDKATFDRLAELLDTLALIQQAEADQDKLGEEREKIYEKQEQLRANLGALQPTGKEAALRDRLLGQLEQSQNRLEEIEHAITAAAQQVVMAEEKIKTIITELSQES